MTPEGAGVPVEIVGSSNFSLHPKMNAERTYNMFIADEWLVNYPGWSRTKEFFDAGVGRGIFASVRGNFLLVVINSSVIRLDPFLTPLFIGNITTATGEVSIDENLSSQICIVDGLNAYIYNHSQAPNLTRQTSVSDVFNPNYVCYHNTYFLFGNSETTGNGASWYIYKFDTTDPTSHSIVQASSKALQTKPDYARAVKRMPSQGSNVIVFGETVAEIWSNVPGEEFYRKNTSFNIDYGCLNVATIATSDKFVVWLGVNQFSSPAIIVCTGQSAQAISTDGIDKLLDKVNKPKKSTASFYAHSGHLFYQLTFYDPSDNFTIAYDFITQKFYDLSDGDLNYHPARQIVFFNQQTYFVSLKNASLYKQSPEMTTYNEYIPTNPLYPTDVTLDDEIPRIRITRSIRYRTSLPLKIKNIRVTIEQGDEELPALNDGTTWLISETGFRLFTEDDFQIIDEESVTGLNALDNYLPRVDLSLSKNGGTTFGNTVGKNLNAVGNRQNILKWSRLGRANDLTFQFRFWTRGRVVVNNGIMEIE